MGPYGPDLGRILVRALATVQNSEHLQIPIKSKFYKWHFYSPQTAMERQLIAARYHFFFLFAQSEEPDAN